MLSLRSFFYYILHLRNDNVIITITLSKEIGQIIKNVQVLYKKIINIINNIRITYVRFDYI